jgi:outer membrane receptor protein involved in Fe transport
MSTSLLKMKGAADLNLDFNYKLNEKWGFWIDLNNIANIQYQRWNQYTAYGFNFRGGVKYVMGKPKKN